MRIVAVRRGSGFSSGGTILIDDPADGLLDGVLHGPLPGLPLPALEGRAVVGEGEFEVPHQGNGTRERRERRARRRIAGPSTQGNRR